MKSLQIAIHRFRGHNVQPTQHTHKSHDKLHMLKRIKTTTD